MFPFDYKPASELPKDRNPDALMFPQSYPPTSSGEDRHVKIRDEFRPILGDRVKTAHYGSNLSFAVPFKGPDGQTPGFPNGHPHAGEPRYEWYDRGDGTVFYGYKLAGADDAEGYVDPPPKLDTPDRIAKLEKLGMITPEEAERLKAGVAETTPPGPSPGSVFGSTAAPK